MMSSFLMRLLLAIVLVVNGTGSALASASGLAPAGVGPVSGGSGATALALSAAATPSSHRDHGSAASTVRAASGPEAQVAMTSCHEAAADPVVAVPSDDNAPAHGHCCHDACHCVCALQAHAVSMLPAPVPARTMAGLAPMPGWAAPDPALLLRPPIA